MAYDEGGSTASAEDIELERGIRRAVDEDIATDMSIAMYDVWKSSDITFRYLC